MPMPRPRASARLDTTKPHLVDESDQRNTCSAEVDARLQQAEAAMEQARAWHRIADVGEQALAAFTPAAETIHGFGRRLDALCRWLTGKWPWITVMVIMVLARTIYAAPGEAPKLIEAMAGLIKAIWG